MQLSIPDLDLRHIYESGQCFRWEPLGQDTYRIPAFGRTLTVRQTDGVFDFSCGAGEFDALWRSYFDLDTDYAAIKARVAPRDAYLQAAVAYGWGMRILRQDLWEVIVSFIVSQNNNIPRIRKNLRDLCAMQGGAFPTPAALAAAQSETLRALGLGYRAEYLCAAGAHFTQAAGCTARHVLSGSAHGAARRKGGWTQGSGLYLPVRSASCGCISGRHPCKTDPVRALSQGLPLPSLRGLCGHFAAVYVLLRPARQRAGRPVTRSSAPEPLFRGAACMSCISHFI